jgi:hypothetical protein
MALRVALIGARLIGQGIFGCFAAAFALQTQPFTAKCPAQAE